MCRGLRVWVGTVLLGACASTGAQHETPEQYAALAGAAVEQSNFARAVDLYDLAIAEARFPRDGAVQLANAPQQIAAWRIAQARALIQAKNAQRAATCVDEALGTAPEALTGPELADAYALRGRASLMLGQRDRALADLRTARGAALDSPRLRELEDDLTGRPATLLRAAQALQRGAWADAEREYGAAIAVRADVAAHEGRGSVRLILRRGDDSLADFDAALACTSADAPPSNELRSKRAAALQLLGRHGDAVAELTKVVDPAGASQTAEAIRARDIDPVVQTALLGRGMSYEQMQPARHADALRDFERVIAANPNGVDAYEYRAKVLYSQGEYERAHGDLLRAQELGSPRAADLRRLMDAAFGLGDAGAKDEDVPIPQVDDEFFDQWLTDLEADDETAGAGGEMPPWLAELYRKEQGGSQGNAGAGSAEARPPVEDAQHFGARLGWSDMTGLEAGYSAFASGRDADALTAWAEAASRSPKRAEARFFHGLGLARNLRFVEAEAEYTRAIELAPTNVWAHIERATAREHLEKLDLALADWNAALELDPKQAVAWERRGAVLQSRGDELGAVRDYAKAIELGSRDAWAFNSLTWIKVTSEKREAYDPAGGLELAKRLLELAPDDPASLDTVACAYAANGDFETALEIEDRALKLCTDAELKQMLDLDRAAFAARKTYRDRVRDERGGK
jgi:tetratricopeptide (TPR) repeat protein